MKKLFFVICILAVQISLCQENNISKLEFSEYLAIVKKYHPLVKQAGLVVDEANFKLLKARGAFDPKIEAELSEKKFKSTDYYNLFNSAFKIPTYYGLELNAKYEENSGEYLNPQNKVPDGGLYSAGISLDITNGLFMSERMAALRKAKIYRNQSQLKQSLLTAEILYDASTAYFNWYAAYEELLLYQNFLRNAEFRLRSVKTQFRAGDKPAVDTLEANITMENREIQLQQAELDYYKASLKLSNYLWIENNIPLEITSEVIPNKALFEEVNEMWLENEITATNNIEENPKLIILQYNIEMMEVERRLRANKLLPNLDLSYNFLTSEPEEWQRLNTNNYKFGFNLSLPLFLRKERGDLQLAKIELENSKYELINANQEIANKLESLQNEIISFRNQRLKMDNLVSDYRSLVSAEQRKFELGDSSLFLVNNRENSFISAKLKEIEIILKYLKSQAELLKITTNF
ncbi:TolC family protein [Autumnicola musiva]|uniref:TolC family protein n=1 Tax=Autumnicola musiva TaxID=3075589 RepID=A0ABU3DAZ6_9FLAO|nr:TolC family protein [Zunongwangia sp. F117]MDT0678701.1 TolC family protein [Zunongwangia sp. F117]